MTDGSVRIATAADRDLLARATLDNLNWNGSRFTMREVEDTPQVRHYYGRRLLQREFWQKLFTGKLNILGATRELMNKVRLARSLASGVPPEGFQHRMAAGLRAFQGSVLFVLSGEDFTAKEFIGHVGASPAWQGLLNRPGTTRIDVPGADHTFSSREWRRIVENACLDWLKVNGHDKGPHVA